jgi:two-component system cell cycle response regulator DivK
LKEITVSEKATILVIEDHPGSRMLLVDVLGFQGYEVYEAGDGIEGLEQARLCQPDLILTDMGMPRMSGWEMVPAMKKDPDLKHIPIVAITAFAMTGDREKALDIGCDWYISKPIEVRRIREQVADFLAKARKE